MRTVTNSKGRDVITRRTSHEPASASVRRGHRAARPGWVSCDDIGAPWGRAARSQSPGHPQLHTRRRLRSPARSVPALRAADGASPPAEDGPPRRSPGPLRRGRGGPSHAPRTQPGALRPTRSSSGLRSGRERGHNRPRTLDSCPRTLHVKGPAPSPQPPAPAALSPRQQPLTCCNMAALRRPHFQKPRRLGNAGRRPELPRRVYHKPGGAKVQAARRPHFRFQAHRGGAIARAGRACERGDSGEKRELGGGGARDGAGRPWTGGKECGLGASGGGSQQERRHEQRMVVLCREKGQPSWFVRWSSCYFGGVLPASVGVLRRGLGGEGPYYSMVSFCLTPCFRTCILVQYYAFVP